MRAALVSRLDCSECIYFPKGTGWCGVHYSFDDAPHPSRRDDRTYPGGAQYYCDDFELQKPRKRHVGDDD